MVDVVEEADGDRAGRVVKAEDVLVRDVLDQGLVKRVLEKDGERGILLRMIVDRTGLVTIGLGNEEEERKEDVMIGVYYVPFSKSPVRTRVRCGIVWEARKESYR